MLKVGDIIYRIDSIRDYFMPLKIERVTKKQAISGNHRFRLEIDKVYGVRCLTERKSPFVYYELASEETNEKHRKEIVLNRIKNTNLSAVELDKLERILAILNENQ